VDKFYYNKGIINSKKKDFKKALNDFNIAIQLNNKEPKYYFKRALIQIKLDQKDNACNDFRIYKKMGGTLKNKINCN
jgi:tetratricopeptide (TPR) repeat protein